MISVIYHQVILDSAIFKKTISQKAESFILANRVVLSQTFFYETRAIMPALDNTSRRVLINNLNRIVCMIKNRGYTMTVLNEPFDVCQKAVQLSLLGNNTCVITENELIINRLLSGNVYVDVYDLNCDNLIHHNTRIIPNTIHIDNSSRITERIVGIKSGSRLSLHNDTSIVLGEPIGTPGREGKVYSVIGHPDIVAKIYKKHPSSQRGLHLERLASLSNLKNLEWCLLPKDLLYYQGELVGFTMAKVTTEMLSNDTLYLGDDEGIEENRLSLRRSYTLSFCLMILAQIKILNCYGICVPDYNDGNFSMFYPNNPVTMFDTDSFAESSYFGKTVDDTCFSRNYNTENNEQLCEMCEEGALKFIFRLISLGLYPFGGKDQPYQFSDNNSQYDYRRRYFPDNVITYLGEVFMARQLPSLSVCIQMISVALNELTANPQKDITVRQMCLEAQIIQDPFSVVFPLGGCQTKSGYVGLNTSANTETKKNQTITSIPVPETIKKRKHHFWPWAASILVLLGGIAYYFFSQGTLF